MDNNTQNIIQNFFKHLSERNLKELTNLFSDKVDWYIPGDKSKAPWLGIRSDKQEVSDFYKLLWKNTEPISVKVEKILVDSDTAVISGEFSTKMLQTGKIVDSLFFIQITIHNNLIARYRLLEDSLAVSVSLTH
jgi:uncharacterized protein